jgi:ligand-binding sensor domain-containing protein/signal transduction histidine kinase
MEYRKTMLLLLKSSPNRRALHRPNFCNSIRLNYHSAEVALQKELRILKQVLTIHRLGQPALLIWLALASSLAFCLDPQKSLHQYGHRSWQTDNGLPQNTVHAVIQTRDGYIWLATEGGLVRFDGVQFVVYDRQAPARLPSTTINCLFEVQRPDGSGDLWIGTDDGLVRRRSELFTTFGTAEGLPSNTIWKIFEARSGDLWIVTPAGLAHYSQGHFQSFPISDGIANAQSVAEGPDGSFWIGTRNGLQHFDNAHGRLEASPLLPQSEIEAVSVTRDGRVWTGTRGGLYSLDPTGSKTPALFQGLPSNEITALRIAKDGNLWIGTARGAAVLRVPDTNQPLHGPAAIYTTQDNLPGERVESFYQDREGAMWIATNQGVARIFQNKLEAWNAQEGLPESLTLSIFEDRERSLWLGTESAGLVMIHDQKFTTYTTADGLSNNLVHSVTQGLDGSIYVGTNGGGLNHLQNGKFTSLTTANGLSSDIVLALSSDSSGDLWVGTPDGLDRIRNGRITAFTSADGLTDDFVRSIYAASDGSMWIGTRRGLSHLQGGRFTTYSRMDGLGSDLVGAVVEDHDRSLWIGTLNGLTHFDRQHNKFTTLTTHDGLSGNAITALYVDPKGALWIGTNQGGLDRLRDRKITAYPPETTHLPESVYAILEDAIGNLWLSSRTGIYRVSKEDLNNYADRRPSSIAVTGYGTADGMKITEASSGGHPAAWKLTDGAMWFATLKGVAAVDPEHIARNMTPPPVAISEVLIDDRPVANTEPLSIAPGVSRFEFHYTALSFIAPQKVGFRYKLVGFDHDWIDAGSQRTAYYTNLPPRQYSFRVIACNNDGIWNETGVSLDFRLRPRFYQTYWFYLLLAAGLALSAYEIYRWRLRQVELRYDAVLAERSRIAREIHDTLAQGLVGISVQLELVNRMLASSIESARTQLDQARALVRDSIAEARTSIWDLRSQAAETEDFAGRLSRMAAVATETSDPPIKVKAKVSGAYRPLSPRTEAELLRIAQEAVINAVRHAKPTQVAIELRFAPDQLNMTIHDNGCGFDEHAHPQSSGPDGHFGLTGMRERAEQIGAAFAIESTPGKGTQVSIHVPIDA